MRLGRDVFARGMPATEEAGAAGEAVPAADTAALFRACLAALEKEHAAGPYRPEALPLWRLPDALARLRRLLPAMPGVAVLEDLLPENAAAEGPDAALRRRAAPASTLLAGLEIEREGSAALAQERAFGRIRIAAVHGGAPAPERQFACGHRRPGAHVSASAPARAERAQKA